jgi:hypothetical protein
MARLTLTNDRGLHLLVLERERAAGYGDYDEVSHDSLWLAVHRKRRFPVQNYKSFLNGDFVASAGTLIYKGRIGEEALTQLYGDFTGDVKELRQNTLGNYMIALKQGSTVFVFVDKYEFLQVYYYSEHGAWVIANSLSAVAMAASKIGTLRINELALLEKAFSHAILGNESFFDKIYKLLGTELLAINTESGGLQIIPGPHSRPRRHTGEERIDELTKEFASRLREQLCVISDVFSDIRIMSTGGIDSRLLLAGLLSVGARPGLIYGVGNSVLTNTRDEDLDICKKYSEVFDLELYLMDWRTEKDDVTKDWDQLFNQYGFYGSTYGGSRAFFEELEIGVPESSELILTGYFGETIRYRPWLGSHEDDTITIGQFMAEGWLHGQGVEVRKTIGVQRYSDLCNHVRQKLLEIGDRTGIKRDGERYSTSSFYMLYDSNYTRDADVEITNLLNHFVCCLLPLASHDLHRKAYEIPLEYRKDDRFVLKVIKELNERLLDIPFFSHVRIMELDRRTFQLRQRGPAVIKAKVSEFLRRLGVQGKAYRALGKVWLRTMGDAKTASEDRVARKLRKQIESILYREQERASIEPFDLVNYYGDIPSLMSYAVYLYYINEIINERTS